MILIKDKICPKGVDGKRLVEVIMKSNAVDRGYFKKYFLKPDQKTTRYSGRRVLALPLSVVSHEGAKKVYLHNELSGNSFIAAGESGKLPRELKKKKKIYVDYFIRSQDFIVEQPYTTSMIYRLRFKKKLLFNKSDIFNFRAQRAENFNIGIAGSVRSYSPSQAEVLAFYRAKKGEKTKKKIKKKKMKGRYKFWSKKRYLSWLKMTNDRGIVDKVMLRNLVKVGQQIISNWSFGWRIRLYAKAKRRAWVCNARYN